MRSESPLEKVTPAPPEGTQEEPTAMSVVSTEWNLAWEEFGRRHRHLKHGSAAIAFVVFTVLGQSVLSIVQLLSPVLPWFVWPIMFLATTVFAQMYVIKFAGAAHERTKERLRAEHESEKETIRAELKKAELRYEELTKYKIEFKVDEVSSRVFTQATSKDTVLIQAKIKLQFENKDIYPWSMKELKVTLHKLEPQLPEITTYVVNDEYMDGSDKQSIPRDQFEGMLIQGGRVTPWYTYWIWLVVGSDEEIKKPEDLTGDHFLRLSMQASNQNELHSKIFPDWAKATKDNGASIQSFGAPAFRIYENRRLGK
jgi:hypothetical protein